MPIDGVLAVGDRPTVIAARVAQALGLPGHPPEAAADRAATSSCTRERLRDAGLPVPWFVRRRSMRDPRGARPRSLTFPCVVKPRRAVGQPRRDARRRCGVVRRGVRAAAGAAAVARHPRRAQRGARRGARRGVHPGPRVRARRRCCITASCTCWRSSTSPIRSTVRSSRRRSTSRRRPRRRRRAARDRRRRSARAAAALGLRHGPIHAECRVNDATACSCSRWPRGRSAACARARCGSTESATAIDRDVADLARGAAAAPCARRDRRRRGRAKPARPA